MMNLSTSFPPLSFSNSHTQEEAHSTASSLFSLTPRTFFQMVVESSLTFLLVVLGLSGNFLVLLAVWKEKSLQTIPNVFVVNLAVTDFLFSLTVLPLTGVTFILGEWRLGTNGCRLQGLVFGTVLNATLATMTAISINRFVMIRHRGTYKTIYKKNNVRCMVLAIWCYAFIMATRPFYGFGKYAFNGNNALCSIDNRSENTSKIARFVTFVALYSNILIILRCYAGIYRTVRQHRRRIKARRGSVQENALGNHEFHGEDINIAKTLFIVVCLFAICWFPSAITGILVIFRVPISGIAQEVLFFTVCLASVVNPVVYAVRNRRFRRTFKRLFRIDGCCSATVDKVQRISTRPDRDQTSL